LHALIGEGRAAIIGPIRQELLSGMRSAAQFDLLRTHLRAFPDLVLGSDVFEEAARFFNLCRSRGVQGSNTDFLICAASVHHEMPILTTDAEFTRYARFLPIKLHELR
jgi:predicted nucleic acid-binding protein